MNWIKPLHKWLSLLVGVQLFVWLGTGLYFNLADHQAASGNALRQSADTETVRPMPSLVPVSQLPVNRAEQIKLHWIQGQPYYQVIYQSQPHARQRQQSSLYDAVTGVETSLSEEQLTNIALASYTGQADIRQARQLTPPVDDLPGNQNPVWQVVMDDGANTAIYVDSANGRVVKHMNDDSRLWDFMLMLHFMDYTDTGGFNMLWIQAVALGTLLLTGSGLFWLVEKLVSTKPWRRTNRPLVVADNSGRTLLKGIVANKGSILESLAAQNIQLPSNCGGGGSCGLCLIKVHQEALITPADRQKLSQRKLALGYRLGCQHSGDEFEQIELIQYTDLT